MVCKWQRTPWHCNDTHEVAWYLHEVGNARFAHTMTPMIVAGSWHEFGHDTDYSASATRFPRPSFLYWVSALFSSGIAGLWSSGIAVLCLSRSAVLCSSGTWFPLGSGISRPALGCQPHQPPNSTPTKQHTSRYFGRLCVASPEPSHNTHADNATPVSVPRPPAGIVWPAPNPPTKTRCQNDTGLGPSKATLCKTEAALSLQVSMLTNQAYILTQRASESNGV